MIAAGWFSDLQVICDVPEASGTFSRLNGCYCSLFDPFVFLSFFRFLATRICSVVPFGSLWCSLIMPT